MPLLVTGYCHFCCILLVKASHMTSPDPQGGGSRFHPKYIVTIQSPLMGFPSGKVPIYVVVMVGGIST